MASDREAIMNQNPNVTHVVAEEPGTLAVGIAHIGAKAAESSEESKLLMYGAQMHAQYKALDSKFRMDYADNPQDPQGLRDLAESRQQLAASYSDKISSFYTRKWQEKTADLASQSDISNEAWSVQQNYHNTINNTNTAMKTYLDMGNKDGQAFGATESTDGSNVMNFLTARQQLTDFAGPTLGKDKAGAILKNFDADYVKSFVSGVAENNPVKAEQLLEMPEIKQHFSTQDREDMTSQIARVKKMKDMQQSLSVTVNNSALTDIANDSQSTYYEKRAKIDQLDMAGAITPQAAAKARRVIKSSADLDTQTDTPVMAEIINQIYDLNATSTTNGDDYLRGVRNVQNQILDMQSTGKLTGPDAVKLNKQLTTLTSNKLASATQQVGNEFYSANQKFTQLPPEFRGEATRQLFYASDGKNFTPQQFDTAALSIIDNVNKQRRDHAQQVISATSKNDTDMLKELGYSSADVTATAKQHHVSEEEVIRQLRLKRLNREAQRAGKAPPAGDSSFTPAPLPNTPASPAEDGGADNGGDE